MAEYNLLNLEAIQSGDILLELRVQGDKVLMNEAVMLALCKEPYIYGHSYHAILPNINELSDLKIFTLNKAGELSENITNKVYNLQNFEITIQKAEYPIYIGFAPPLDGGVS